MSVSQLARDLHESATLRLNKIALNLRELGQPVIHLGGGEEMLSTHQKMVHHS
jgi:hypothetical protein